MPRITGEVREKNLPPNDVPEPGDAGIDASALQDLAAESPYGEIFEHMRRFQNGRSESTIDCVERWIEEETGETKNLRAKALRFMKAIDKARAGRLVVGRGGKKTRVRWLVDRADVARLALGEGPGSGETNQASRSGRVPGKPRDASMRTLRFPLRQDFELSIEVPCDLTPEEANRLGQFLGSIAIPPHDRSTAKELARSRLIGLWKDRKDIRDSSSYASKLRREASSR